MGESLNGGELDALRFVGHRLAIRPARGLDATPHVDELRFGHVNAERANRGLVAVRGFRDLADCRRGVREGKPAQRACRERRRGHADKVSAR